MIGRLRRAVLGGLAGLIGLGMIAQASAAPSPPGLKPGAPAATEDQGGGESGDHDGAVSDATPKGMGVSLRYPAQWSLTAVDGHTVVLGGAKGGADWYTALTLTNQQNPAPDDPVAGTAVLVTETLRAIEARTVNHERLRQAPFHYVNDGPGADGEQAVIRFMGAREPMRSWVVAIARTDIPVAHILIYTAPDNDFDRGLPAAQLIVESLTVRPAKP
ncbi:hypothetical protein [Rhodospirillum rubrum]|uniref:Uncharacterized protein n=2 Tax=Rhodospirillum rubrum TaxID=1085 RepID=Q2RQ96_RHORT|nr:hypothetical protein [Rhodospirillum rubrum]ABC23699.1 hypothetical protein Rru_A2902 [Rhodospirillum rubrum ATCC 11170]AEO49437.1 hypothetical protein F11_14875 [Rhodospirillum rubrum F11]MBK5955375.1 hypothetical protein [Rhodospirillum rubrum]QXG79654.1 hypothetical protein KUL73_14950 [Rhodospirillum rubrum]